MPTASIKFSADFVVAALQRYRRQHRGRHISLAIKLLAIALMTPIAIWTLWQGHLVIGIFLTALSIFMFFAHHVDYQYDWVGRRIKKVVAGTVTTTTKYLYNGWNLIAELDGSNNLLRTYAWGLDLSGTSQGTGGVGGLLYVKPASAGTAQFCAYDGNGNLTALEDGSTS